MEPDEPDLVRYWFEFDVAGLGPAPAPPAVVRLDGGTLAHRFCWRGVGVTGFDESDCIALIADVIAPEAVPPIARSTRNVDVSTLGLEDRWVGAPIVPAWRASGFRLRPEVVPYSRSPDLPIGVDRCRSVRQSENVSDDPINHGGLYCYDCITRVLCPEAHCDPNDPTPVRHDPSVVDLTSVARAVSVYHGRALCLPCLATYLDGV